MPMGVWDKLAKTLIWRQLDFIHGQRVLDFGSGEGYTAAHFALDNEVTAIEPDEAAVAHRAHGAYRQLTGTTPLLNTFPDGAFDVILCHNVLEYAQDRENIVQTFSRLLVPGGLLSVVKHNRPGRVLQMAVLLNRFDAAHALLDGADSTGMYGDIHYYDDADIPRWCDALRLTRCVGLRTFFDLQQNQEIQQDAAWQEQLLRLEERVGETEPYRQIAFFHHNFYRKQDTEG